MSSLAINGGKPLADRPLQFVWPPITDHTEDVLIDQLHQSISIYDDSGIFGEFEQSYAAYHGMPYALLTNSGTSALQTAYYALMLAPGDEVICPVYTFHATVSPMMHFGLVPVMADCDQYGQLSVDAVRQRITSRTKAVVVTHMWGYVADIAALRELCDQQHLMLIEDCSHAHGAQFEGRPVGSFGDIAIWSLQGQKIITGGEGGMFLTKHADIFERAVLYGHYNKRCKKQIQDAELRPYVLTGAGLKLRATTFAAALAYDQFKGLEAINAGKQKHAAIVTSCLDAIEGVEVLAPREGTRNSWYAQLIRFDEKVTSVSRERLVEALHAEGLIEFDIPGSTGLLDGEPLFNKPQVIFPYLYDRSYELRSGDYPNARRFYDSIVKLPVWASPEQEPITQTYCDGIRKVLAASKAGELQ